MPAQITAFDTRSEIGLVPPDRYSTNITPGQGGVAGHYAGGAHPVSNHEDCRRYWRRFQSYHMKTHQWSDLAYTGGFCQHGVGLAGRGAGIRTAANGTNTANDDYYAICWIGGGSQAPSEAAVEAFAWWVRELRRSGGAGRKVVSHSIFKPTACCGDPLRARLARVVTLADGHDLPPKPSDPDPQPTDETNWTERIVADLPVLDLSAITRNSGTWIGYPSGDPHVRTLQGALVARGRAPRNTIDANGSLDGIAGPGTRDALRDYQADRRWTYSTARPDLVVGPLTWRALLAIGRP